MSIRNFNLLTDEHFSPVVVQYLRGQGFDVVDVCESGWQGRPDHEILAEAFATGRVVVSQDSDFGTLIVRDGHPAIGVVRLNPGDLPPSEIIALFDQLLKDDPALSQTFIVSITRLQSRTTIRVKII